jgi:hypothetical protein
VRRLKQPRPSVTSSDVDRFWRLVDFGDESACWPWNGTRNLAGYGRFWLDGSRHGAHRISVLIATRKWAGGLFVLHSCDNPPCCNPAHLRIGTAADNAQDASSRGRTLRPGAFARTDVGVACKSELADKIAELGTSIRGGRDLTPHVKNIAAAHGVPATSVYSCTADIRIAALNAARARRVWSR